MRTHIATVIISMTLTTAAQAEMSAADSLQVAINNLIAMTADLDADTQKKFQPITRDLVEQADRVIGQNKKVSELREQVEAFSTQQTADMSRAAELEKMIQTAAKQCSDLSTASAK